MNEAWWNNGECTWIIQVHGSMSEQRSYSPAGAQLYDGTSGIALALAMHGSIENSARAVRTARAAARFALSNVHRLAASGGLLGGPVGVAVAVYETGRILDDKDLIAEGCELICKTWTEVSLGVDYGGGIAGRMIAGAWAARRGLGSPKVDWLEESTRMLIDAAREDESMGPGLVHGKAGIAIALLAAADLTGEQKFYQIGDEVLESVIQAHTRESTTGELDRIAWCNGLPGLLDVVGAFEQRRSGCGMASRLADTCRSVVDSEPVPDDGTVCHGVLGWLISLDRAGVKGMEREASLPNFRSLQYGVPPGGAAAGLYDGLAGLLMVGTLLRSPNAYELPLLPFGSPV